MLELISYKRIYARLRIMKSFPLNKLDFHFLGAPSPPPRSQLSKVAPAPFTSLDLEIRPKDVDQKLRLAPSPRCQKFSSAGFARCSPGPDEVTG